MVVCREGRPIPQRVRSRPATCQLPVEAGLWSGSCGADGASATALQPPPHLLTTLPAPAGGGRCVHPGAPPTDRAPSLRPPSGSSSELASSVSPSSTALVGSSGPLQARGQGACAGQRRGRPHHFACQGCRRVRGDQHDRDARARKAVNGLFAGGGEILRLARPASRSSGFRMRGPSRPAPRSWP